MRNIKFRAWDEEVMFIPSMISSSGDVCKPYGIDNWVNAKLMQFTGLKDKNGKEIYEGDICEVGLSTPIGIVKHRGVMIFREKTAQFCLEASSELESIAEDVVQNEAPEIIGDIYTTPELLKNTL